MATPTKFHYDGQDITFEFADGNRMINATEMAKPFGKKVNDFLRINNSRAYIELLEERYANTSRETLRVVKGGEPHLQGTWMDELLALKFAAWLSPRFELWVYDRIQELLTTGETKLDSIAPKGFASTLRLLAAQWEQQEQINQTVRGELDKTAQRLDSLEAKVISSDENYYTIAGYCSLHHIDCPLPKAKAWGKMASDLSRQKGIEMGEAHDERYGRVRTYHRSILDSCIK